MDRVTTPDRTSLLSDNGPDCVSRAFMDYLGMVQTLASPFHPQTNGKLERYHQVLKRDVNQLAYEMPSDLETAIVAFVRYYNCRGYHKATLGERDGFRRAPGKAAGDPATQKGGSGPNDRTAKTAHQGPQGAHETSFDA